MRFGGLDEYNFGMTDDLPLPLHTPLDLSDTVERTDAARILDANANRAREAARVLEDFTRFSLNDAFLSRQMKDFRHDLAALFENLPSTVLISARNTLADVGADIGTVREQTRNVIGDVVVANAKRLQESLRSLEEYGKIVGPQFGERAEALRYRSYTLERALVLGAAARAKLADARLYVLLTASTCRAALDWTIAEVAAGGATVIQLREKSLPDGELLERARNVRRWTRKAGVLFIVNDRPDIARLAEADGVHLGQDDLPIHDARRIVGPDGLIGVSTHNLEQVRRAVLEGASYIGVGPTFVSATKNFEELAGLDFVRAATAETSLPAFVLGGVTVENVHQVVAAGGRRIAVSAALARAEEPRARAAALRRAFGSLTRGAIIPQQASARTDYRLAAYWRGPGIALSRLLSAVPRTASCRQSPRENRRRPFWSTDRFPGKFAAPVPSSGQKLRSEPIAMRIGPRILLPRPAAALGVAHGSGAPPAQPTTPVPACRA